MLKLICSESRPFADTDFSSYEELINKALNEGHLVCSISYFHGILETALGYDIGACLNAEECVDKENNLFKEGIYDAEVEGYEGKCRAYFWNDSYKRPRGLIVDISSEEDVAFANKKYQEKSMIL